MESNHKSVNGNVVANGVSELRSDDDMDFDGASDVKRICLVFCTSKHNISGYR